MTVVANKIKTKGVSIFNTLFEKFSEIIINMRGKNKYFVVPFDEYEAYRAYKLDMAHQEVLQEISEGKYHSDTQRHFDMFDEALKDVWDKICKSYEKKAVIFKKT